MEITAKKTARVAANVLPPYRVYAGLRTAHLLSPEQEFHDPECRTWNFAARVAFDAATDKVDGVLARFGGPTQLGGYLDQLADKAWFLTIAHQLALNGEIRQDAFTIPLYRDVGLTAIRPVAQLFGLNSDARHSGKIKMLSQTGAVIAACSPIAAEYPELVSGMFDVASGFSVASGLETVSSYANQLHREYSDTRNPAALLVVQATTELVRAA